MALRSGVQAKHMADGIRHSEPAKWVREPASAMLTARNKSFIKWFRVFIAKLTGAKVRCNDLHAPRSERSGRAYRFFSPASGIRVSKDKMSVNVVPRPSVDSTMIP